MMCQDEIERGSRIQKVQEVQEFHGIGIGIAIGIGIVFHPAFDSDTDTDPEKMSFWRSSINAYRHRWTPVKSSNNTIDVNL